MKLIVVLTVCVFITLCSAYPLATCRGYDGWISCGNETGIATNCCSIAVPATGKNCCPMDYPNCNKGTCCPPGYPTNCPGSTTCCDMYHHCDQNNNCANGGIMSPTCTDSSTCPDGGSCCKTTIGNVCCPFANGVCCNDTCCPNNYTCGMEDGYASCNPVSNIAQREPFNNSLDTSHVIIQTIKRQAPDQSYQFVPISSSVKTKCQQEANKIYCNYTDANAATASCLFKQATGYCAVSPQNCWNLVPLGSACLTTQECINPVNIDCTWYASCLQQKYQCPSGSYPMDYGYYYCNRFLSHKSNFTQDGQMWIDSVLLCLQKALVGSYEHPTSCSDVTKIAFDSHPRCYLESTPNFCDIAFHNKKALFSVYVGSLWDAFGLLKWGSLKQMITVLTSCLESSTSAKPVTPAIPLVVFA